MGEATPTLPKAFTVTFSKLQRWDPNSFHGISWHWPASVMRPIGSVLKPRKEKVDRNTYDFTQLMPVTIHFDGSIEPRKLREDKEYTMELFWARPGDVVASKIDLKNGAVAIIPDDWNNVVVTNHFAVYEPDLEQIDPKYFHLLIQAKFFKDHLWRNKVGAEGRKEVKLDFFESQEIPIPNHLAQKNIISYGEKYQRIIQESMELSSETKKNSHGEFQKSLGIEKPSNDYRPKFFIASWSNVERWGNDLVWKKQNKAICFSYPTKPLNSICNTGSGGTPSRKNKEYYNGIIPWIKTSEVLNSIITDTEEKITEQAITASSAKIYPSGSLIIAMYGQGATRGRTAKLGVDAATNQACLVLTNIDEALDVDFLWYYLMISYDEMRSLASGNNQPNLSADLLGDFPIPIPPKHKQLELKNIFESAQAAIAALELEQTTLRAKLQIELEQMILGTRKVDLESTV